MKVRMTTLVRTALIGAAILGVAAGFLPAWASPVGIPTPHVVAAAQPGDGIVPVGTPTPH